MERLDRTAIVVCSDLMFQPRIVDAARGLGIDARVADGAAPAEAAIAAGAAIVVIDLQMVGVDAVALIVQAKAAGARVLAFGRHTEPAALRAARRAGASEAVPRSQLVDELPQLLARLMKSDKM